MPVLPTYRFFRDDLGRTLRIMVYESQTVSVALMTNCAGDSIPFEPLDTPEVPRDTITRSGERVHMVRKRESAK